MAWRTSLSLRGAYRGAGDGATLCGFAQRRGAVQGMVHPSAAGAAEAGRSEMLNQKLRRDILDVLAQTAGLTFIGMLLIETAMRFQ